MQQRLSDNIKIFSFVATIFVVYRHSLNYLAFFGTCDGLGYNGVVQDGFMNFTQIAVPYFFLVSGFFFFKRNYYENFSMSHLGESALWKMYRHKVKTLLVPFVIWNFIGLLSLIVTKQEYKFSLRSLLLSDWYGPLWYVRDLMLFMLLAPTYQWLLLEGKSFLYTRCPELLSMVVLLVLLYYWKPMDTKLLSSEGMLFFFIGGLLRKHKTSLLKLMPFGLTFVLTCGWLCWSFYAFKVVEFHTLYIFLGLFLCWNLVGYIPLRIKCVILKLSKYSFLIYVLHFYLIKVFKVVLGNLFWSNELASLFAYLCLPILCSLVIIEVGKLMQKCFPNVLAISLGGRV